MTAKEKAQELIDKFENVDDCDEHHYERFSPCCHQARQCAIICVEQIIATLELVESDNYSGPMGEDKPYSMTEYYQEVLSHLKNS